MATAVTTTQNIDQYQGEDKTFSFTVVDSTGTGVNITGWNLTFSIYSYDFPSETIYTQAATLTSPTTGVLSVSVPSATSSANTPNAYRYRIERTDSGNDTVTHIGYYSLLAK